MSSCARYALSDGTLCSTHNRRFGSPTDNRCEFAKPRAVLNATGEMPDATWDEPRFQRWVVATARANGWRVRVLEVRSGKMRRTQKQEPGWPDLVMVHPVNGVIWAELKAEGKKPSLDQDIMAAHLIAAGQRVYLWEPTDWEQIMVEL